MNKHLIIFTLASLFFCNFLSAQFAIKTTPLIPLRFINFKIPLIIACEVKLNSRYSLRSDLLANRQIMARESWSGALVGAKYEYIGYFEKAGLRVMLKRYRHKESAKTLQQGFFLGIFSDMMYAQRHDIWKENGSVIYNSIPGKGLILGGGIGLGKSWKWGKWCTELSDGLGLASATGSLFQEPQPDDFFDGASADNFIIIVAPTHIQFHVGREF